MFYTPQPEKLRAFFRDKFKLPFTDVGGGWLIFDAPGVGNWMPPVKEKFSRPLFLL